MKKIGLISDVHGNYEALMAILKLFGEERCDEIIHTGDVVDIGPKSRECLELLLSLNNVVLTIGNHDRDFAIDDAVVRSFSHVPQEHKRAVFDSMDERLREEVKKFPLYVVRQLGRDKVVFTHYAFKQEPYDVQVYPFLPFVTSPAAELFDEQFKGLDCNAVFFGHKHEPCDIRGERLYVDVGSVGCHPEPYARGIIIEYDENNWSYRRVGVPYDMAKTRTEIMDVACGEQIYDFYYLRKKPATE
ncbi:MAG: metallophosphatase family protein [Roseburia sp.]|nr:metallophosphatase family protein [Roseburia sp.]